MGYALLLIGFLFFYFKISNLEKQIKKANESKVIEIKNTYENAEIIKEVYPMMEALENEDFIKANYHHERLKKITQG